MIWLLLNALMAAPFFAVWTGVPFGWSSSTLTGVTSGGWQAAQPAASGPSPPNRNSCASPDAGKHPNSGVSTSFRKCCTQISKANTPERGQ